MDDIIIHKKYRCRLIVCEDCKKEVPRQLNAIKLTIKSGKPFLCKSCILTRRNKANIIINCSECGIFLDDKNTVVYGKKTIKHSSKCKKCFSQDIKNRHRNTKLKVIDHYGGKCSCCGEDNYEFLCIDHVNNDGSIHRKKKKNSIGSNLYKELIGKNFDVGYELQLLCWNCNLAKQYYDVCPHQRDRTS